MKYFALCLSFLALVPAMPMSVKYVGIAGAFLSLWGGIPSAFAGRIAIALSPVVSDACFRALTAQAQDFRFQGDGVLAGYPPSDLFKPAFKELLESARVPSTAVAGVTQKIDEIRNNPHWDAITLIILKNLEREDSDPQALICPYYGGCVIPGAPRGNGQAAVMRNGFTFAIIDPSGLNNPSNDKQVSWLGSVFALASHGVNAQLFREWRKVSQEGSLVSDSFFHKHVKLPRSIDALEQFVRLGLDSHVRIQIQTFLSKKYLHPERAEEEIRQRYQNDLRRTPQLMSFSRSGIPDLLIDANMPAPSGQNLDTWAPDLIQEIVKDIGRLYKLSEGAGNN